MYTCPIPLFYKGGRDEVEIPKRLLKTIASYKRGNVPSMGSDD